MYAYYIHGGVVMSTRKYVIDPKSNITNVMTEMSGVTPIPTKK